MVTRVFKHDFNVILALLSEFKMHITAFMDIVPCISY